MISLSPRFNTWEGLLSKAFPNLKVMALGMVTQEHIRPEN